MKKFTLLSVLLVFLSGNYSCGMEDCALESRGYPLMRQEKFNLCTSSYGVFDYKMKTGPKLIHGEKEVFKINGFDVHTLVKNSDVVQLSSVNERGVETWSEYSVNKEFRCDNYFSEHDDEEGYKDCGYNRHFVEYCKSCRERRPYRFLEWKLKHKKDIYSASLIMFWNRDNELTNHVHFENGSISVESLKKYIDLKKHVLWVKNKLSSSYVLSSGFVKSYLPSYYLEPRHWGWRIKTEEDGIVDFENPWENISSGNSLLKLIFSYKQGTIDDSKLNSESRKKLKSLLKKYDFVGAFEGDNCLTNRNNILGMEPNEEIIESLERNGMRLLLECDRKKLDTFFQN